MATPPEMNPYAPPVADCRPGAAELEPDQLEVLRALLKKTREHYGALAVAWGASIIGCVILGCVAATVSLPLMVSAFVGACLFTVAARLTWKIEPLGIYLGGAASLLVMGASLPYAPIQANYTFLLLPVQIHALNLLRDTWRLERTGVDIRP